MREALEDERSLSHRRRMALLSLHVTPCKSQLTLHEGTKERAGKHFHVEQSPMDSVAALQIASRPPLAVTNAPNALLSDLQHLRRAPSFAGLARTQCPGAKYPLRERIRTFLCVVEISIER